MTEPRILADILAEITACEQKLIALKDEIFHHPDAQAGKDLPPVTGTLGGN